MPDDQPALKCALITDNAHANEYYDSYLPNLFGILSIILKVTRATLQPSIISHQINPKKERKKS